MVTRGLCILMLLLVPGMAAAVVTPPPVTAPTVVVDAAAARRLEREAWSRLREGRPEAAAEVLREALRWLPGDPRLLHNLGVADAQSGAYQAAAAAFREAAEQPGDPALRARARYNEAASLLLAAQEGADVDPAAAPRALEAALHATREALAANPEDDDARANGELAWRLLEQLRQNAPQSGGDGGDGSPESGEDASGEPSPGENTSSEDGPSSASEGADGSASDTGDQGGEPRSEAGDVAPQEGGEGADAAPQPAPPDDGTATGAERSAGAAADPADQDSAPSPERGAESGASPAAEPEPDAARDAPAEPKGASSDDGRASGGERAATTDGSRMTPDAAERILQRIRDAERQRREAQRRAERLRQPPVEKDW
ncbi:MAG: hypothetical protein KF817_14505 [Phycisphaeraceae bacterium]|nr:hypothetical protein [Phycisphaeraceae bacterium]